MGPPRERPEPPPWPVQVLLYACWRGPCDVGYTGTCVIITRVIILVPLLSPFAPRLWFLVSSFSFPPFQGYKCEENPASALALWPCSVDSVMVPRPRGIRIRAHS